MPSRSLWWDTVIEHYSPNKLLLSCIIFLLAIVALIWDQQWFTFSEAVAVSAESSREFGAPWLAAFMERLPQDYMTTVMLFVLLALIIYGILQIIGALADARAVRPGGAPLAWRFIGAFSGRSWRLLKNFHEPNNREHHFSLGREVLAGPLRLGQWMFPVVGFIGTIIGISGAVERLPHVLDSPDNLDRLLSNLHTAFDTTFVGLAASVLLMFIVYILDAMWDQNEVTADALLT